MPNTVVDLVGQGDGVRPWGGCWPPYWDSASSDLGSEGTRGLCTSRAEERLRLPRQRPLPVLPHTLGLGAPHPGPRGEGLASR